MNKRDLLTDWAQRVTLAGHGGMLGKRMAITHIETVSGPRAGALHILAGLDAGRLLDVLSRQNCALLRQMVPWDFQGDPAAFMYGRFVRLEAGWSDDLADSDVPLSRITRKPSGNGRWVVGIDERGRTIVAGCNLDQTPHWLVSGTTGSGKTVALRNAVTQLCRDEQNRIVLVDGKLGASFRHTNRAPFRLRHQVGPVAVNPDQWRGALVWATREMVARYENGYEDRLIVFVDEVQEIIQDQVSSEALRRLVTMGRDAGVHVVAATQHPVVDALGGPTVARNLGGRLSFRVNDKVASRVALNDSSLPADSLLGRGDAIIKVPEAAYRIQGTYVTDAEIGALEDGDGFELDDWPEAVAEDIGVEVRQRGRRSPWPGPVEIGTGLMATAQNQGRDRYREGVEAATGRRPGSGRADRMLDLCRATLEHLQERGWEIARTASKALIVPEIAFAPPVVTCPK